MTKIITLLRTNFLMLVRQRALIISSLGLAIISMLVFGYLFGGNGSTKTVLGVVDQDRSNVSAQVVSQLKKSNALQVYTGKSDEEQQAHPVRHDEKYSHHDDGSAQRVGQSGDRTAIEAVGEVSGRQGHD